MSKQHIKDLIKEKIRKKLQREDLIEDTPGIPSLEIHHYHPTEHSHYEYALRDHLHDGRYSSLNHSHTEYAERQHSHSEYSQLGHTHDERYAPKEHTHKDYAKEKHYHSEYAPKEHSHTLADISDSDVIYGAMKDVSHTLSALQDRLIEAESILSVLERGQPGQILFRTRQGYEWRYPPPSKTEIRYIGGSGATPTPTFENPILFSGTDESVILWGSGEEDYLQWG